MGAHCMCVCSSGDPPIRPYIMPAYRVSCPKVETTCGSGRRVAEISVSRKLVRRGNKFNLGGGVSIMPNLLGGGNLTPPK